jgi:hypothetical protein
MKARIQPHEYTKKQKQIQKYKRKAIFFIDTKEKTNTHTINDYHLR